MANQFRRTRQAFRLSCDHRLRRKDADRQGIRPADGRARARISGLCDDIARAPSTGWSSTLVADPHRPGSMNLEGPRTLQVLNYVGVIETPCGTQIEILPKYTETEEGGRRGASPAGEHGHGSLRLKTAAGDYVSDLDFQAAVAGMARVALSSRGVRSCPPWAPAEATDVSTRENRSCEVHSTWCGRYVQDPRAHICFLSSTTSFRLIDRKTASSVPR